MVAFGVVRYLCKALDSSKNIRVIISVGHFLNSSKRCYGAEHMLKVLIFATAQEKRRTESSNVPV